MVSGRRDGTLYVHDLSAGPLASGRGRREVKVGFKVRSVACDSAGQLLVLVGEEGVVRLWDIPSGRVRASLPPTDRQAFTCATLIPSNGQLVAAGSKDGAVVLWDPAKGDVARVSLRTPRGGSVAGVFSRRPDTRLGRG